MRSSSEYAAKPSPLLAPSRPGLDLLAQRGRRGERRADVALERLEDAQRRCRARPCRRSGTGRRTAGGSRTCCAPPRRGARASSGPPRRSRAPRAAAPSGAGWRRSPARSATSAGRLPTARRNADHALDGRAARCRGRRSPRCPGVHSGGLNQCTPRNRAGSPTASASPAIGSEEVLEAMIAAAGAAARDAAEDVRLEAGLLGHRLDHQVGRRRPPPRGRGGVVTRSVVRHRLLRQQPGVDVAARALEQPLAGLLAELGRGVDERDRAARHARGGRRCRRPSSRRRARRRIGCRSSAVPMRSVLPRRGTAVNRERLVGVAGVAGDLAPEPRRAARSARSRRPSRTRSPRSRARRGRRRRRRARRSARLRAGSRAASWSRGGPP